MDHRDAVLSNTPGKWIGLFSFQGVQVRWPLTRWRLVLGFIDLIADGLLPMALRLSALCESVFGQRAGSFYRLVGLIRCPYMSQLSAQGETRNDTENDTADSG